MALDISKEISFLRQHPEIGNYLGEALQRLQDGVNTLGTNLGADATQTLPPPPKVQRLNIATDGNGNVHGTIDDNNPIQKGLHYFVEYSTDKAFSQPHVKHLGASRTLDPMPLPAKTTGGQPQVYYFRAYSQYPGSHPGEVVHFGGNSPTPVAPGGTTQLTLLPSTGSGTAPNSGQRGNSGFGRTLFRKL
jgi:hypothetical protein